MGKIVINLWHIKNTNGLFYYALDYIDHITAEKIILLNVNFPNSEAIERLSGNNKILKLSLLNYVMFMFKCFIEHNLIFTPSSHPIPFIKKQLVIVHDMYPFHGFKGNLKKILFCISAKISRCKIGYINRSQVLPALLNLGINPRQLVFAPNKFPDLFSNPLNRIPYDKKKIIVGLVGTDSDKKNYHELLSSIRHRKLHGQFNLMIYGHETPYFKRVNSDFPDLNISLVKSDVTSLRDFLTNINILISICRTEGFGRPIATALVNGVPCFLINCPVFREFFSNSANVYPTTDELINAILEMKDIPINKAFIIPTDVKEAFFSIIDMINNG
ncbi:glycosyltransferase [Escherichia coli]|uniref:glycosyltransferase n=1 Tax=Enterobacteriaceae TaxID=543 RepID=UPI000DD493CF|nr:MULTISPECIES: glycosyltransferase [Enterobacteriaceae]EFJ2674148.1 glycosyltransferase [Escherichia coli]EFN6230940.1 glycosyltransferase [Escherichia coli]EHA7409274.1 glycosyltransferase [Escherichia coli]MCE3595512.1 glycosyltransferase [Escherichia coli]MCN4966242.1 glycosyltransferase [Escherichia coli]